MSELVKRLVVVLCLVASAAAQGRRLWVLEEPESIVEYDPATFAPKPAIKVPEDVLKAARILQINHRGQMLFAPNTDDPSPDVGKNGDHARPRNHPRRKPLGFEPESDRVLALALSF